MQASDFDFRVWNKKTKTFTYAKDDSKLTLGFSNKDCGEVELYAYYDGKPMCPSDIEIDLWSGFIDIDGEKIYERDIIDSDFSIYGLVFYEKGRFLVKHDLLDDVESLDRVIKYTTEVELAVVDNIHEKKLQMMS